jgi:hypothetical protein
MVTRARTLILLGVTVAAFLAALTAGRALRPAGVPPAAAARTIVVQSPTIAAPLKLHGRLSPLADPRPRRAERRPDDNQPDVQVPDESQLDTPVHPDRSAQPQTPAAPPVPSAPAAPSTPEAPSPQQPSEAVEPRDHGPEDSGNWSSGN